MKARKILLGAAISVALGSAATLGVLRDSSPVRDVPVRDLVQQRPEEEAEASLRPAFAVLSSAVMVEVRSLEIAGDARPTPDGSRILIPVRASGLNFLFKDTERYFAPLPDRIKSGFPSDDVPGSGAEAILVDVVGDTTDSVDAVVAASNERTADGQSIFLLLGSTFDSPSSYLLNAIMTSDSTLRAVGNDALDRDLQLWSSNSGRAISGADYAAALEESLAATEPYTDGSVLAELRSALFGPPEVGWDNQSPLVRGFSDPLAAPPEEVAARLVTRTFTVTISDAALELHADTFIALRSKTANVEVSALNVGSRSRSVRLLPDETMELVTVTDAGEATSVLAVMQPAALRQDTLVATIDVADSQIAGTLRACNAADQDCPVYVPSEKGLVLATK